MPSQVWLYLMKCTNYSPGSVEHWPREEQSICLWLTCYRSGGDLLREKLHNHRVTEASVITKVNVIVLIHSQYWGIVQLMIENFRYFDCDGSLYKSSPALTIVIVMITFWCDPLCQILITDCGPVEDWSRRLTCMRSMFELRAVSGVTL